MPAQAMLEKGMLDTLTTEASFVMRDLLNAFQERPWLWILLGVLIAAAVLVGINVRRTYLPMHSIVRIDEVDKQGTAKISKLEGGNVAQFPMPVFPAGADPGPKR